jgi:hypothetical protein
MAKTSTTTNTVTATNADRSDGRTAPPPLSIDRAMVYLSQRYQLRFRHNGLGWFFAQLTVRDRCLFFRLGGKSFLHFLRRTFPGASSRFLACLARRYRFRAWLGSTSTPPTITQRIPARSPHCTATRHQKPDAVPGAQVSAE